MATQDQCAGSDEVFKAIGKNKNNMDQIDKTNINDTSSSYVKINFQLITYFIKDLHLCRIWDFVMQNHSISLEMVIVVG